MKKILFVGEHPFSQTGNANMLMAILNQLEDEKYQVGCFVANEVDPTVILYNPLPITFIPALHEGNKWGPEKVLNVLQYAELDILCMVGLDIWRYGHIFDKIRKIKKKKPFVWISIFPYDLQIIRQDWLEWINMVDYPCVYSEYGYRMLKDAIPKVQYFRPPLNNKNLFYSKPTQQREALRQNMFGVAKDRFIFGFIGENQLRKDPQRLIKAFFRARENISVETTLYLHTELEGGMFNLYELMEEYLKKEESLAITTKTQGIKYSPQQMADVYNSLDCLVNCTMQEGLSWTPLEAMLCGLPVIASDTTAQTEIIKGAGILVPCEDLTYLPIIGADGETWVESRCCKVEDIARAMVRVSKYSDLRTKMVKTGLHKAEKWMQGISNINELLDEAIANPQRPVKKIKKILFAQESSAGDVLMTTRCFKGLKEKHPTLPLVYMTSKPYFDILKGNPYVDEIVDWDSLLLSKYQYAYAPHKENILEGNWGRNSVGLLSDLYWKILNVEPDDFFIKKKKPSDKSITGKIENTGYICVVHTTGGDPRLRTFRPMRKITKELKDRYYTIQLGSQFDYPADADLDLRGKLSFRESAWVMGKASIAISVDSFISHLAGALGINQVVLFGCGSPLATRPVQTKGFLICRAPDYLTDCPLCGHCSGQERLCPTPCINVHRIEDILKDIDVLEKNKGMLRTIVYLNTSNYIEKLI